MKRAARNLVDAPETAEQTAFIELIVYLEAMTELEPNLPVEERQDLQRWYRSPQFTRDSDWPGWVKYLGPHPQVRPILVKPSGRRRSA
jgi:hypothetical protein